MLTGSGGELMDDHVICPKCAHNFPATSQADQDRLRKLEATLRDIAAGEIKSNGEIDVRSDSMRIAHEALWPNG